MRIGEVPGIFVLGEIKTADRRNITVQVEFISGAEPDAEPGLIADEQLCHELLHSLLTPFSCPRSARRIDITGSIPDHPIGHIPVEVIEVVTYCERHRRVVDPIQDETAITEEVIHDLRFFRALCKFLLQTKQTDSFVIPFAKFVSHGPVKLIKVIVDALKSIANILNRELFIP